MKITSKAPIFIRICSYFSIFMAMVSIGTLATVWTQPREADKISMSFISNSVRFVDHPSAFICLALLFIFSGIVGAAIVFRKRYAYDLGIAFSLAALAVLGVMTFCGIGLVNGVTGSYATLILIFGGFAFYLFKKRKRWNLG